MNLYIDLFPQGRPGPQGAPGPSGEKGDAVSCKALFIVQSTYGS